MGADITIRIMRTGWARGKVGDDLELLNTSCRIEDKEASLVIGGLPITHHLSRLVDVTCPSFGSPQRDLLNPGGRMIKERMPYA
jgi:hypothetical protein